MKWKNIMKHSLAAVLFLAIVLALLLWCTYLFRAPDSAGRQIITYFYSEPKNSLDVVYIGGSNVYRYFTPMQAWHDYGMASYNYTASGMPAAGMLAAVQDVERHQNPRLVICDVRKLLSGNEDTTIAAGIRNLLDAQDLTFSRMRGVSYFTQLNHIAPSEALSEYFDLIQYHSNYAALADSKQWDLIDNRTASDPYYNGFMLLEGHRYVSSITSAATQERIPLSADSEKILLDLITYCNRQDIPLLLVSSPFFARDEKKRDDAKLMHVNWMELNTIADLAEENGVPFLNANAYCEQMQLDFQTDFYDNSHVNILGARKYTDFLCAYLREHYTLPDHRGEPAYADWDGKYLNYEVDATDYIGRVNWIVARQNRALADEETMKHLDEAEAWLAYADNPYMTLLMELDAPCANLPDTKSASLLKGWGLTEAALQTGNYAAACVNGAASTTGTLSEGISLEKYAAYAIACTVSRAEGIRVDGKEYHNRSGAGIHIVCLDNTTCTVFDEVLLGIDGQGRLTLQHLPLS